RDFGKCSERFWETLLQLQEEDKEPLNKVFTFPNLPLFASLVSPTLVIFHFYPLHLSSTSSLAKFPQMANSHV
ncbi:hypothetical protein HMPREF1869_00250, partial [Bacteroidales bacterium KA00251]